ncbi:helix-turn-helix transcriptional regulator [Streptomyces sp. NPDC005708]|uniref:helix-turn-helix domain-containing protein n=1 Tax=Streptomyces sp. NPDC005708 TaxID=3154564 RepID=UPI003411E788
MNPRRPKTNGGEITNRRIDAGLSQTALARRVGCTKQLVSGAERGANGLSLEVLSRVAGALDCTVRDLLLTEDEADTERDPDAA